LGHVHAGLAKPADLTPGGIVSAGLKVV